MKIGLDMRRHFGGKNFHSNFAKWRKCNFRGAYENLENATSAPLLIIDRFSLIAPPLPNRRTRSHRRRKANPECIRRIDFMANNNSGAGSNAAVVAIFVIFLIVVAAALFFFGGQFFSGGGETKKVDVNVKAPAEPGKVVPSKSP